MDQSGRQAHTDHAICVGSATGLVEMARTEEDNSVHEAVVADGDTHQEANGQSRVRPRTSTLGFVDWPAAFNLRVTSCNMGKK